MVARATPEVGGIPVGIINMVKEGTMKTVIPVVGTDMGTMDTRGRGTTGFVIPQSCEMQLGDTLMNLVTSGIFEEIEVCIKKVNRSMRCDGRVSSLL